MLATLQKFITILLAATALGWLVYFGSASPWLALGGFLLIAMGYTGFLAIEFGALRFVHQSDPAPQPTWKELLGAWWGETKTAPQVFCWRQPFRTHAVPDQLTAPAFAQPRIAGFKDFQINAVHVIPMKKWNKKMRRDEVAIMKSITRGNLMDAAWMV